ncbi:MAG: DUF4242 domain-containing protein [Leptolyngbyaceae cyanobacterium RU_5_1]|nr:DUF4242 domain-containing protein [Leptolyngbyaceae cyanobacterium RU_5_1]
MSFAVLERSYLSALAAPMTYEHWMQVNHSLDGSLEARDAHWLYSLVSAQGDRSVCLFEVPYTETVREACREAQISFQHVWQAEQWLDQESTSFPQGVSLVVAEVNFDPPMSKTHYDATKSQAVNCFQELNIQPLVSLISLDGKNAICLFVAASAEHVRSLYRKINKPFEQVWKATLIQPIE